MTGPLTPERKQGIRERVEKANAGEVWPAVRHIDVSDLFESHEALAKALVSCADDLEAELNGLFPESMRAYPSMQARFDRDMETVRSARAALRNAGVTL